MNELAGSHGSISYWFPFFLFFFLFFSFIIEMRMIPSIHWYRRTVGSGSGIKDGLKGEGEGEADLVYYLFIFCLFYTTYLV